MSKPETPLAQAATANDDVVRQYINDYEFDDGESIDHTPSDFERLLIADAIVGLLDDPDFVRTYCAWKALGAPAPQPSDEQIKSAWRQWPQQAITSASKAIEFVRFLGITAPSAADQIDVRVEPALTDFVRRDIERAIRAAEHPGPGMQLHDGIARIRADRLRYLLRVIDGESPSTSVTGRKPLPREQIDAIWANSTPTNFEARSFARAIEAAHGITAAPEGRV